MNGCTTVLSEQYGGVFALLMAHIVPLQVCRDAWCPAVAYWDLEWQTTLRCREGCICLRIYVPHDLDRWTE